MLQPASVFKVTARLRPTARYQVASADHQSATPAKTTAQPKPQTVADIINARGFWGDEKATAKQATAEQIAAFRARLAFADPQATASVNADIKPWTGDEKSSAPTAQALAYAPNAPLIDRSKIVTASAPIPRSIRPGSAAKNPMSENVTTVIAKGVQPVPTTLARLNARTGNDPWLRAMILAPDTYRFMVATTLGDTDMTAMRIHFVKPQITVAAGFIDDPTPGLLCERFTGTATTVLTTTSFKMRTASLR